MTRFSLLRISVISLALLSPAADSWSRGFGGGFHGGGGGYHGGGGAGGGGYRGGGNAGGYHAGGMEAGGMGRGGGGYGGGMARGGGGAGGMAGGGAMHHEFGTGSQHTADPWRGGMGADGGNRYSGAASRGDLNHFLGMPSDEGLHSHSFNSGAFDVNRGAVEGPRGGYAAGATVTGPRGGEAARGVAVGPNGRVAGGAAVRGPEGYGVGRGFVAGPGGAAAGFARVTPTARYACAAGVRGNFNHYDLYGRGWYGAHPGCWNSLRWAEERAWYAASWREMALWLSYSSANTYPMYYDYGNNVVYNDNSVNVNGQSAGTPEEYYGQATTLAKTGAEAQAPADDDWLPLGVFALAKPDHEKSNLVMQLAVNKQGVIRGNYTDTLTNQTLPIQGSVDKAAQRVDWTVGDHKDTIFETGLYNLTKDESPLLEISGKDKTEQWLLVRLQKSDDPDQTSK